MVGRMRVTDEDILKELQDTKLPAQTSTPNDIEARLTRIESKLDAVLAAMTHIVNLSEGVASQVTPIIDELAEGPVGKVLKSMGVDLTKGNDGKRRRKLTS